MHGILKEVLSLNASVEIITAIFIFLGALITGISSMGMIRLPDVYTRAHAAAKTTTLGVMGIVFGTFLYFLIAEGLFSIRLLLGILFVLITAPVSSHMIIRSAYHSKVPLSSTSVQDDLEGYFEKDEKDQKE